MNLFVPIDRVTADALLKLADREVRTPKQQALVLIREGLEKAGLLVKPEPDTTRGRP